MQDSKFIHALIVCAGVLALPACSTTSPVTTGSTDPAAGDGDPKPTETVSTPTGLSTSVADKLGDGTTLSFAADGKEIKIPVHASRLGGEGAPSLVVDGQDENLVIDGVSYKLTHESESDSIVQGSAFALVMAGVGNDNQGAAFIGTGPAYGDTSEGADVKRFDILLRGTPTDPAKLPTTKADYVGEYAATFLRLDGGGVDQGTFNATADFGAAQSVTGSFVSDATGNEVGTLSAAISGNGFTGTGTMTEDPDGLGDFAAAGMFTGDGATGIVGAGQRGTASTYDVVVFEGTKQP